MLDHMTRFYAFDTALDAEDIIKRHAISGLQPKPGYVVNFLGVLTEPSIYPPMLTGLVGQVESPPIPANWHADMAEWAAVLRAVDLAGPQFRIIELGCAWGCWMCSAGKAALRTGRDVHLIGVEGDDKFVALAEKQMAVNGFVPAQYTIHRGIAAAVDGTALFPRQADGAVGFGSAPVFNASRELQEAATASGSHDVLDMIALDRIMEPYDRIDLLHIDIQGGEAELIDKAFPAIAEKVAYVFVGTHSRQIEGQIFDKMLSGGFVLEIERAAILSLTEATPVVLYDGVQAWRNTRFH